MIASYSLPGGRVALRKGDVSVVLLWCANRWHETVEPLRWPGNWGYAERLVRGSAKTISDHASGTAIDLNAPLHPLGVPVAKTFTPQQIKAIRAILEFCEGTVGWGGDYRSRPDGMHLYIQGSAAAVKRVADKIRTASARLAKSASLRLGSMGTSVSELQRVLNAWYPDLQLAVDGDFGPATEAAVREFQRRSGLATDGIAGPVTLGRLGLLAPPDSSPNPT
jgi:hypothetical protein